ncbi:hypothetical protein KKA15_00905 [Patescibacteria group bacterium]|nr:hypothetical protein [Patescibacteria group bacterium]
MPKIAQKLIIYLFKIIFIVGAAILIFWLIGKDLVMSGYLVANYDFSKPSPFITTLRPQGRVLEPVMDSNGDYWQNIIDEPIYFDMRIPRHFDIAEVSLTYNNLDQEIFEFGILADKQNFIFDLRPVFNAKINNLLADKLNWSQLAENDLILFQKEKKFISIDEFVTNPPALNSIATYNFTMDSKFVLPEYNAAKNNQTIDSSLRGNHTLLTYIKNETLNFEFLVQDVNRHVGEDYLSIDVYNDGGDLVVSEFLKDDGNISDNGNMSIENKLAINEKDLAEGLYRIEFKASNDDIFIRQIKTTQSKLVFKDHIYLADDVGYKELTGQTVLYSNGYNFFASTPHIEGMQSISIGSEILRVQQTHQDFAVQTDFGIKEITMPKNDIKITTRGLFGFSKDMFFDPAPTSLKNGLGFDEEKIEYVIARYDAPSDNGKVQQKLIRFNDLDKYDTQDNQLHFVISLPQIKAGDDGLMIKEINIVLKRIPKTWQDIASKIKQQILAL